MKVYNKRMDGTRILFGCHRGDQMNYPENTMPAMEAAVEIGCDIIETDVRMTKDGHLILIHDRDVQRTTNGTGFVDEMTLEEIKALDAGFWKGSQFMGTEIPTVEEFLEYISQTNLMVNWELKEYPLELGQRAYECADKLLAMIRRYDMVERSMMNCFSNLLLEYIADTYPDEFVIHSYLGKPCGDPIKRPLETFSDWTGIWDKPEGYPAGLKKDYEYAREHDVIPCILVADTEENYKAAIELGCRMFTSNDPAVGLPIVRALERREVCEKEM